MAPIDERVALVFDEQAFLIGADMQVSAAGSFDAAVSDTRFWRWNDRLWAGICLPELDRIQVGSVRNPVVWPSNLITDIGPRLGDVVLHRPVSLAAAPDDRIYIADSGNDRIVSVTRGGDYITSWGQSGTGADEFDFGVGQDVAGSIVVDDDGFIYVADVINQRIQKFAP